MVIEMLSQPGWGGMSLALDFIKTDLARQSGKKILRPWILVEAEGSVRENARLYPPALPHELRGAMADQKLLWVRVAESAAASTVNMLLETGLCEGLLLVGLERFSRLAPATLWARRWQLSARKGGSHFLWVHEAAEAAIGFEVRLKWTAPGSFEIKKGHGFIEAERSSDVGTRR
ncbi:MAG: hypothetical protein JST16_12970, partial [Bdellovibrionales bacterium]|nr:hypothetical protein [Bdellovibrionales bacterium]